MSQEQQRRKAVIDYAYFTNLPEDAFTLLVNSPTGSTDQIISQYVAIINPDKLPSDFRLVGLVYGSSKYRQDSDLMDYFAPEMLETRLATEPEFPAD